MSKKAKCPRCGASVTVNETVVTFGNETEQQAYDEAHNQVEEILEEIQERIDEGEERDDVMFDMEQELQDARQAKRELGKGGVKRDCFYCDNCGYTAYPAHDEPYPGVRIYVTAEEGIGGSRIFGFGPDAVADTVHYFTDAAYRESQRDPEEELPTLLYYRIQVWDEESGTVKIVAEGGDRKLYDRLLAKEKRGRS